MRKIGLLGGTFDPVHFGHLRLAEQCQQKLDLEEIWFIPAAHPPHKDWKISPYAKTAKVAGAGIRRKPKLSHFGHRAGAGRKVVYGAHVKGAA